MEAIQELIEHSTQPELYHEVYNPHVIRVEDQFEIDGYQIQTFPTKHKEGSCGVRIITNSGLQVVFTGDVIHFPELPGYLKDLDLLVIECSFHDTEHHMHLNLEQVSRIAGQVNPKAVLLVHLYPEMEALSEESIKDQAAEFYGGDVCVARDGLRLRWNAEQERWDSGMMF